MRDSGAETSRARRVLGIAVCALVIGCAGTGDRAGETGTSAGDPAPDGFGGWVTYPEGEWGQAWAVSGRGVTGLAPRGVAKPDCTGVEDESLLYVGDLLANPGSFVSTLDGALDQAAYHPLAASDFRLTGERAGGVIGLLQTTAGRRARFVLTWDVRPRLHDLVVYDAETGDVALRFEIPMPLAPHALVNLDPGEPGGFDLLFGPAPDGRLLLAAGENAALSFPLDSLCAE
jgi:hypothetical protein